MRAPSIRILSPQIDLLYEIDRYTSLQFERSWQGVGEWELHLPGSQNLNILTEGNLVLLGADGHRAGIIRGVRQEDAGSGIEVVLTGQTLNGLAAQRYTLPLEDGYNGGYDNVPALTSAAENPVPVPAETILKTYAARHLTAPADAKRKIPGLILSPDLGRGRAAVWMSRYEQLDAVLQLVSEYTDTGWEIFIDLNRRNLVFDVIPGVDRTTGQDKNSRVIFSMEFESAESLAYYHDVSNYRNLAYAGGAGEGAQRLVLKVTNDLEEPAGLERFETFIDCGALELTETDTTMSLSEEGKHKLLESPRTESLTATVAQSGSFLYGRHWNLGDLVTVVDRSAGVARDARVTRVAERYEAGAYSLEATFGEAPQHLARAIRQLKNIAR